jgi:RHS repeat-associated protein
VSGGVPVRDVQYQYDRVGNRQVVTDNGVPVMYTVNNMNQYTTVGGEPLSYDANGNLTSMPGLSLQYDSWNRLISAATESNLVLFAYDGRHRCVKRVEIQNGIGRTTFMVWGHEPSQGWGLLEERGANGELIARHVHGPSVDDLVLSELGGAVYYYHHDHLNSTIAVTDESGNAVEQYRYDVFGQPFFYSPDGAPRAESAIGTRFLFTGREWLDSLGLYDYRHRIYSPSLGRFLQVDPLGFGAGGVNLYLYSTSTILVALDQFGLRTVVFYYQGPQEYAGDKWVKKDNQYFRRGAMMYKVWCDWTAILVPIHDQSLAAKYLEELRKKGVVITKVVILHHYTHLGATHLDPDSSTWRKITEKLEPGAGVEHWGCKAGWEIEWLQSLVRKSAVPSRYAHGLETPNTSL